MPGYRGGMCGVVVVIAGEEAGLGVLKWPGRAVIAGKAGVAGVAGMARVGCSLGMMLLWRGGWRRDNFGESDLRMRLLLRLQLRLRLVLQLRMMWMEMRLLLGL